MTGVQLRILGLESPTGGVEESGVAELLLDEAQRGHAVVHVLVKRPAEIYQVHLNGARFNESRRN